MLIQTHSHSVLSLNTNGDNHLLCTRARPQGTGDTELSAGQPSGDEDPDAGGKEGGKVKKSVLL